MLKYIGSKQKILPFIIESIKELEGVTHVGDLFSGSGRVGQALKQEGYRVTSNDYSFFSKTVATALVQADLEDWGGKIESYIELLNNAEPKDGFITEHYCRQARYFQEHNGQKIDGIREKIESLHLDPELKSILVTSLLDAACKVDSTVGVQTAFLKTWSRRSYNNIQLKAPDILPRSRYGKSLAIQGDCCQSAAKMDVDVMYLDPPYTAHSYMGYYHIWETIALGDKPSTYGKSNRRESVKEIKSDFNSRQRAFKKFQETLRSLKSKYALVSYSNEGIIKPDQLLSALKEIGEIISVKEIGHKRYIGYNLGGILEGEKRVSDPTHKTNTEFLFTVKL